MLSMKAHFRAGEQSESLTSQSFNYICPEQKMANISPRAEIGIIKSAGCSTISRLNPAWVTYNSKEIQHELIPKFVWINSIFGFSSFYIDKCVQIQKIKEWLNL